MTRAKTINKYVKALAIPVACCSLISFFPSSVSSNNTTDLGNPPASELKIKYNEGLYSAVNNISASQLKVNYEGELYSAVKDKKLISSEVENLHNILTKYLEAKDKKYFPQNLKNVNLDNVKAEAVELGSVVVNDSLDLIVEEFEQKILDYYPYLCSQNENSQNENMVLRYDALETIEEGETLRGLIERAYKLSGEKIPQSMDKESYKVKDILVFNEILGFSKDESSKDRIIHPDKVLNPVKKLSLSDEQLILVNAFYKEYLDARDKEFVKAEKYWHTCTVDIKDSGYVGTTDFFKEDMAENVQKSLVAQGYDNIGLPDFYEGAGSQGKFPQIPGWAMVLFGVGFPFLRTVLTAKYTRREYDLGDLGGNLANAFLGSLVLDTVHPLVYPLRMFAAPFIFEPFRKVTGLYGKR